MCPSDFLHCVHNGPAGVGRAAGKQEKPAGRGYFRFYGPSEKHDYPAHGNIRKQGNNLEAAAENGIKDNSDECEAQMSPNMGQPTVPRSAVRQ